MRIEFLTVDPPPKPEREAHRDIIARRKKAHGFPSVVNRNSENAPDIKKGASMDDKRRSIPSKLHTNNKASVSVHDHR